LAIGYIETTALSQPSVADEVYRNPHHLKSVVRFLTDRQERIHSIAFLMFWVSWALFAVLFFRSSGCRTGPRNGGSSDCLPRKKNKPQSSCQRALQEAGAAAKGGKGKKKATGLPGSGGAHGAEEGAHFGAKGLGVPGELAG